MLLNKSAVKIAVLVVINPDCCFYFSACFAARPAQKPTIS